MTEKIGDTKLSPDEVVVLPRSLVNLFILEGNLEKTEKDRHKISASDLISTYSFFLTKAREQHTNQVYATTSYVHKILGISEEKIRKTKNKLRLMKLIKDVPLTKEGKFDKWLLKLPYVMKRYNREDAVKKSDMVWEEDKSFEDYVMSENFDIEHIYEEIDKELERVEKLNIRVRKLLKGKDRLEKDNLFSLWVIANSFNAVVNSLHLSKMMLDQLKVLSNVRDNSIGEIDDFSYLAFMKSMSIDDIDVDAIKKVLVDSFLLSKHLRKTIVWEIKAVENHFQRPNEYYKDISEGDGVIEGKGNLPKRSPTVAVEKPVKVVSVKETAELEVENSVNYYNKDKIEELEEKENEYVKNNPKREVEPIILWEGMSLEEKREVVRRSYNMKDPKVYTFEDIERMSPEERAKIQYKIDEVMKKRERWLKNVRKKKGELDWEDETVKQVADIVIEGISLGGFTNRIPKNLDKATKGFKTAVKRLYYLLEGVKEEFNPDLDDKWLKDWGLDDKKLFGKKYSLQELRSIVKKSCMRFNRMRGKDYLPSNKDILTKDINEFIYSTQFRRSWMMYCYFRRPNKVRDKIAEKIKNSIPPKFSEKIDKKYKKSYDSVTYWNNMKEVYKWWKKNMETLYWQHFDMGDFYIRWRPFGAFLDRITEWSEDTGMEYVHINPESGGRAWNKFCEWAYEKYRVNLIPDEDVAKLNRQYVEHEKKKQEEGRSLEEELETIEMFTESDLDFSILDGKVPSFKALQRALGEGLLNKDLFIYLADQYYPYWYESLGYRKEDIDRIVERIEKKKYMEDI